MGDEKVYDPQQGETSWMGLLNIDPKGISTGVVQGVNEKTGRISGVLLDYGLGEFTNIPVLFPAVGSDWCIACLPAVGDQVEILWSTLGEPYARPTIPFRYFDWVKLTGNKALKPGELLLRSKGGSLLSMNALGQVLLQDSAGESIFLDPTQSLAKYQAQFTSISQAGSSQQTLGNIKRPQITTFGIQLKDIDLPSIPGILPPNEWHLRVVPSQPLLTDSLVLKSVETWVGDVYDNLGFKVRDLFNGLKTPLKLTEFTAGGFSIAKEFQFDEGSFKRTYNDALPVPLQQLEESYDTFSGVYALKQAVLSVLKEVLTADPVLAAVVPGLSVHKLVDERILTVLNNLILSYSTHTHSIAGAATLIPLTLAPLSSTPVPPTLVTGEVPEIPLLTVPVTTVVVQAA